MTRGEQDEGGAPAGEASEPPPLADHFRLLVEAVTDYAIFTLSPDGRVTSWNQGAERLKGYDSHQIIGKHFSCFYSEGDVRSGKPAAQLRVAASEGRHEDVGWRIRRGGSRFWAGVVITALRDRDGRLVGFAKVTRDITERLQATEREVMLQEVHHRVKNNLQLISSLMSMQSRTVEDHASRNALAQCQTRIQAMALVHEKLYRSKDYSRVPFSEYARSLAGSVLLATGASAGNIVLDIAVEGVVLAVDRAIPCGMILNELVTNAMKHGFRDGRSGTISLRLERLEGGWVRLAVGDDGIGIAPGVDMRNAGSLGMRLVFMLAEQLEGRVEWRTEGGTLFELTFPTGG